MTDLSALTTDELLDEMPPACFNDGTLIRDEVGRRLKQAEKELAEAREVASEAQEACGRARDFIAGLEARVAELERERDEATEDRQRWAYLCDNEKARADAAEARVAELERESDGRRRALMQKADELTAEWKRAEQAEARVAELERERDGMTRVLDDGSHHCKFPTKEDGTNDCPLCKSNADRMAAERERDRLRAALEEAHFYSGDLIVRGIITRALSAGSETSGGADGERASAGSDHRTSTPSTNPSAGSEGSEK